MKAILILAVSLFLPFTANADDLVRLARFHQFSGELAGKGFVTDGSHPMHPGDFRSVDIDVRLRMNPELGEAVIEIESGDPGKRDVDRYFIRRGRIFQINEAGGETPASRLGDLEAAGIAAIHPSLVAGAILERRENLQEAGNSRLFAWNDELWTVGLDEAGGLITELSRRLYDERAGDGTEAIRYDGATTSVRSNGREIFRVEFTGTPRDTLIVLPAGDRDRDRTRLISRADVQLKEIAPHLFAIDLDSLDTRITVAEFSDHLFVIEGAYNSRNCDLIAEVLDGRFKKPVRYFAFSHMHGQYIGGIRSWVGAGATVVVPPTTVPLVTQMVEAGHGFRPDALSKDPKSLRTEIVTDSLRFGDELNSMVAYNIESEHTDEYLVFYFPAPKILLTGDLLFYRPGKPLAGRSKKLWETVRGLGLDVGTCYVTWPLAATYGTKNIVTRDEAQAAYELAKP